MEQGGFPVRSACYGVQIVDTNQVLIIESVQYLRAVIGQHGQGQV